MSKINPTCKEVIEKSEWLAIATAGPDGPHLAACWSESVRALGYQDDVIRIPAWSYFRTEENLKRNPRVELLFASRQVSRPKGQGQGCRLIGHGELQTSGPNAEAVKARFPGTRGALVISIESAAIQL
ncbi:MAG TPA: pyridoxamine 5'-phosphate oxidase family protein [Candidatus Sulfotelmatobacter sp.]|nr:pyridoxamine 5'-phosphate oxidase family protein [Candidatus Sulfotelmatobacter sp.]